jgi:HK97 gp10 family phage protein
MRMKFEVVGALDLAQTLRELGIEVTNKSIGPALRKAARPMVTAAKSLAPRDTGLLRRAIGVTVTRPKKGVPQVALIGARSKKGAPKSESRSFIGRLLEFGTVKMQARPWLRPAYDITVATCKSILISELRKAMDTAAQTISRKHTPKK